MDELKMSFEEMINALDGAVGRMMVLAMKDSTIIEAMEMVSAVSTSLGEWAMELEP